METIDGHIAKRKCIIYIDGYNWYHAVFKHKPELKWLNIQSFFEALRLDDEVVSVKMFSAMINSKADPSATERQDRYFKALKTLPKVKIILGKFQPREVTCRAQCKGKYAVDEEKKTDVNMAVEIMSDVVHQKTELVCLVSGDSDIQPAIEWVSQYNPNVKIVVYIPALPAEQSFRRLDYRAKNVKFDCKFLPLGNLKDHQLKHTIKLPDNTFVCRPESWNI